MEENKTENKEQHIKATIYYILAVYIAVLILKRTYLYTYQTLPAM